MVAGYKKWKKTKIIYQNSDGNPSVSSILEHTAADGEKY
jgi:hypothetical protein